MQRKGKNQQYQKNKSQEESSPWKKEVIANSGVFWLNEYDFLKIFLVKFIREGKRRTEVWKYEIKSFRKLKGEGFKTYGSIQLPIEVEYDKVISFKDLLQQFVTFEEMCFQRGLFDELIKKKRK